MNYFDFILLERFICVITMSTKKWKEIAVTQLKLYFEQIIYISYKTYPIKESVSQK